MLIIRYSHVSRWRDDIEMFSTLLDFCDEIQPVTSGFLSQKASNTEV